MKAGSIQMKSVDTVATTPEVAETTVNSTELNKSEVGDAVTTPADTQELTNNASDELEDTTKADEQTEAQATEEPAQEDVVTPELDTTNRRHVLTYVGSSVWKDNTGKYWGNKNIGTIEKSRTMSDEEYRDREDIQFMVRYGEIVEVVVD